MPTIKLSVLLDFLGKIPSSFDCDITGLTLDSRQVKAGSLFFACKGTHLDGREYIQEAIAHGASAILAEGNSSVLTATKEGDIPVFSLQNLNHRVSQIAATFYGQPANSLRIVGITGTNGKTSCSHFLASAFHAMNISCGVIGTLGNGLYGNIQPGNLTTPDAITLQALFADFLKQGAKVVVMEVSSHSLDQGRVEGVPFEVGVFTNLTRDHLDYHGDMESYGAAKKRLFDTPFLKHAIINADDDFGKKLIQSLKADKNIFAYGVNSVAPLDVPLISAQNIQLTLAGLQATIYTPWGQAALQTALVGQFNVSNVLAVLTTLCLMGVSLEKAFAAISQLKPVAGRMEALGGKGQPLVVVDYAHTPDALEKVLSALKQHCTGSLYCLFGCGGDRDKGKRPMMAKIAEEYADYVVVTDDNPRHEDPQQIVADILPGFSHPERIIIQHDRSKAIQDIIQCAKAGDCVVIAGKGAEAFQQIGDAKIPFSDVKKVSETLNAALA